MVWERFHYICRRSHRTIKSDETFKQCMTRIEQEPGTQLYGKADSSGSIANQLLSEIKQTSDSTQAKRIAELYGDLDFSSLLIEPLQFKRVTIYLIFVTIVFFGVSSIYQTFVAPSFLNAFEMFDLSIPSNLIFYRDYWFYFLAIILGLLVVGIAVGYQFRTLYKYRISTQNSFIFKYLVFTGIKTAYQNILETLYYPISNIQNHDDIRHSDISEHLRNIESSGMDVGREMQEIIRREGLLLTLQCERQMRLISALVAVIIIVAVFLFLVSAYAPIFALGGTI